MDNDEKIYSHGKVNSDFFESTRWTILLFKCVGLLPFEVTRGNNRVSRWIWNSISVMPCVTFITFNILFVSVHGYNNLIMDFDIKQFPEFFFNLFCVIEICLLLHFNKTYSTLVEKVEHIENSLPPFQDRGHNTKKSQRVMAYVIFFTMVDFLLYVYLTIAVVKDCYVAPGDRFIEHYFKHVYPWCFNKIPFTYVTAVFLKISRLQIKITWASVDMFIMIISYYIVVRFQNLNRIMLDSQKEITGAGLPWLELQVHYTRLMRLVKMIDKNVSYFVLTSFTLNVCSIGERTYFLVNKVYRYNFLNKSHCLEIHSGDWEIVIGVGYSVAYLIVRTACVSSVTASINTQSREPLNALYTVPASKYNRDLQNFMDQVYHSKVGLSGLGFFHVTRGMILTVIATLMTYELVLLQL